MKVVKMPAEKQTRLCEGYAVEFCNWVYHKSRVYRWTVDAWIKDGRRYIIASRHRFGSNTVEDVIVGVKSI